MIDNFDNAFWADFSMRLMVAGFFTTRIVGCRESFLEKSRHFKPPMTAFLSWRERMHKTVWKSIAVTFWQTSAAQGMENSWKTSEIWCAQMPITKPRLRCVQLAKSSHRGEMFRDDFAWQQAASLLNFKTGSGFSIFWHLMKNTYSVHLFP